MGSYKDAGVDQAGKDAAVEQILRLMKSTYDPRVIDIPWGFAGLFQLSSGDGKVFDRTYRKPTLVACADGVGTKIKVAHLCEKHDTVGIDLVAMNVNDLICTGGEPLFFLDYVAMSKVDKILLLEVVKGIVEGCKQAGCALLGGETAEMPGTLPQGEYELAGFAVGVTERDRVLDGSTVEEGDVVIALASSGFHSNGYSLVRKVCFDEARKKVGDRIDELGETLGEALLRPTRIYVKAVRTALRPYRRRKAVKAMANITGGGMIENIPRVLPKGTSVEIDTKSWEVPAIFRLVESWGGLDRAEMWRVFNMGVGYVLIVAPYYAHAAVQRLEEAGERAWVVGKVVRGKQEVLIRG